MSGSNWDQSSRRGGDVNSATEVAKAPDQAMDDLGAISAIEVIGTEIRVLDTVTQHEVGGGKHRGCDGEDGLLGAASGLDAEEQRVEVAVLHPHAGPGSGDQGGLEPGAALANPGRPPLARALVVAGTQSGPRDEVG